MTLLTSLMKTPLNTLPMTPLKTPQMTPLKTLPIHTTDVTNKYEDTIDDTTITKDTADDNYSLGTYAFNQKISLFLSG